MLRRRTLLAMGGLGLLIPSARAADFAGPRRALLSSRHRYPSWLPSADGVTATNFADYRTEGLTNLYWNNAAQQANAAAWWASRGTGSTFARASVKNVPAVSTGTLTQFASGARAFTADPGTLKSLGWSAEGLRTNLVLQSGTLTNASWTTSALGVSVASGASDPFGGTAAATITATAGGTGHGLRQSEASQSASTVYTKSIWLAPGTAPYGVIGENNDTPWIWAAVKWSDHSLTAINCTATLDGPYANGFYRLSLTYTRAATTNAIWFVGPGNAAPTNANYTFSAAGTETVIAIGAQDEAAVSPSSYIATTTGSVARAADSQSLTRPSAVTGIGKLLAGRTPIYAADADKFMWAISDGTANNYIGVYYKTNGHLIAEMNKATVKTALDLGAVALNTDFVIAFNASSGNLAASLNGAAIVSNAGAGALPAGLTNETEGQLNTGSQWFATNKGSGVWAAFSNAALVAVAGNTAYWN